MWKEGLPCAGRECPDYQGKKCQEVMNLQFMLPKVPGLGIWQVDTGSINSIRNINSCAAMVRAVCERVSWIPLTLTLEPTEVINPEDGKKKIVRCLNLRHEQGLQELLIASSKAKAELLITAPAEDEQPSDIEGKVVEGEVIKHQLKTAVADEPEKLPQIESESEPTPGTEPQPAKPKRYLATIKSIKDLTKVLFDDFGLYPSAQKAELNINDWSELVITPAEAYIKVATTREP